MHIQLPLLENSSKAKLTLFYVKSLTKADYDCYIIIIMSSLIREQNSYKKGQ